MINLNLIFQEELNPDFYRDLSFLLRKYYPSFNHDVFEFDSVKVINIIQN